MNKGSLESLEETELEKNRFYEISNLSKALESMESHKIGKKSVEKHLLKKNFTILDGITCLY